MTLTFMWSQTQDGIYRKIAFFFSKEFKYNGLANMFLLDAI